MASVSPNMQATMPDKTPSCGDPRTAVEKTSTAITSTIRTMTSVEQANTAKLASSRVKTNILDGALPAALSPTPFSSYGQVMFWLVFAVNLTMAAILNFRKDSVS